MKRSRFSEEQIIGILRENEAGRRRQTFAASAGYLRQVPVERIGSLVNVITYQLTPSTRLRLERVY